MAPCTRFRSCRETLAHRCRPPPWLQGQARRCRRPHPRSPRWPTQGQGAHEAKALQGRYSEDHHGQEHPAHRRRALRPPLPQLGSAQLLLGRPRWQAQVLRGHPHRYSPPRDHRRQDTRCVLSGERPQQPPRSCSPWPHLRRQARTRSHPQQGQGR